MGTFDLEDVPCDLQGLGVGKGDKLWVGECEDSERQELAERKTELRRREQLAWEMDQINPDLFFRAQTKCHFLREAFPDPSPGSHCMVHRPLRHNLQPNHSWRNATWGMCLPYWAACSVKGGQHLGTPSIQHKTLHTIGRQ